MQPGIQQSGAQPTATKCQQCGTELRPGARFCNHCGAAQPVGSATLAVAPAQPAPATQTPATPTAPEPQSVQQNASAASPAAEPPAPTSLDVDESARAKRPPRVPRVREGEETSEGDGEDELAGNGASTPAASEQAEALDDTGPRPATMAQESEQGEEMPALAMNNTARQVVPSAPPVAQEHAQTPAPPYDQPPLAPAAAQSPGASGEESAPSDAISSDSSVAPQVSPEAASTNRDWPLAPGTLVGGRYRVEVVLSAAQTPADENVYRVTDRLGYVRCWSCGATSEPSDGSPPDPFCARCGADMLARPYLMRERMLPSDEAATHESPEVEQAERASDTRVFREAGREYKVTPEEIERSPFELGVHIVIASASDTGRERSNEPNEDSLAQVVVQTAHESYAEPLALGIVADGLGGHASGSEASRMVVDTVLRSVLHELVTPVVTRTGSRPTDEAVKQALQDAITAANEALHAANDESKRDMGSTLVAALILGETAYIANVGDSRGYVYDGAELRRLTIDHSLVEQLVAGGMIAPEERYTHPSRNQIYRSLGVGSGDDLTADIYTQRLRPGLRLLLCSDGLWEMVHDDELAHILHEWPHPQGACDALIAAANANGGEDNISALIIDVTT